MQIALAFFIALLATTVLNDTRAQLAPTTAPQPCSQDNSKEPTPPSGTAPSENLTDRLAETKGVICPPTGIDPDIVAKPPGGGKLKVIPPPGTPGADPREQPK
jgi:hypothetical protein